MADTKKQYKITIEVLDKKWTKSGDTIYQTLTKFPLSWEQIKGKGMLTVKYGKLKHEQLFGMPTLRRIFMNKISRAMWSKRLGLLLESEK